jgi:hypothetical protein
MDINLDSNIYQNSNFAMDLTENTPFHPSENHRPTSPENPPVDVAI